MKYLKNKKINKHKIHKQECIIKSSTILISNIKYSPKFIFIVHTFFFTLIYQGQEKASSVHVYNEHYQNIEI